MKQISFGPVALTLVSLLAPLSLGAGAAPPADYAPVPAEQQPLEAAGDLARENARLRTELESLKAKMSRLEARVKALESGKAPTPRWDVVPRPTPPAPRAVPQPPPNAPPNAPRATPGRVNPAQPRPLPEGWQEREINGMKFYVVPLKPGEANPTAPEAVAPKGAVEVQPIER